MKTPVQEMIEVMQEKLKVDTLQYNARPSNGSLIAIKISQFYLEMAESLLQKEKNAIMDAFVDGYEYREMCETRPNKFSSTKPVDYYNETFKDIPLK